MAYCLPRKKTLKNLFVGDRFDVQEPWDLALLTKTWCQNIASFRWLFLEEIAFGNRILLIKHSIFKDDLLPSAETIKIERRHEMKRLEGLKHQKNVAEKIQFSLRHRPVGLRRPLPPK